MHISGLQKLTLLDFPGHLAAIVFLGGCNFRCPFCQNSDLVLSPGQIPPISLEEFQRFLKKRSGILEGICITGGEPTLHSDLPELIRLIRQEGYLVKLDTNGTNPDMLSDLLEEGLLDYVAMDIKAGRNNYARVCGLDDRAAQKSDFFSSDVDLKSNDKTDKSSDLLSKVEKSVHLLMNSGLEYEFRTTVVGGLHTEEDFLDMSQWLRGCRHYYLQSFRDCPEVLLQGHPFFEFSREELEQFLKIVQKEIPQASLRGIS